MCGYSQVSQAGQVGLVLPLSSATSTSLPPLSTVKVVVSGQCQAQVELRRFSHCMEAENQHHCLTCHHNNQTFCRYTWSHPRPRLLCRPSEQRPAQSLFLRDPTATVCRKPTTSFNTTNIPAWPVLKKKVVIFLPWHLRAMLVGSICLAAL